MINSCSPTVLTINVVDAQTFAIFHTCKCTRIHRIYRIILYRYIHGIEITGWDGSIRMVAGESSGEPTFRGCVIRRRKRMGTDDSGCYWKSNISRRFYSIDLHGRNISSFFHFHPSSCNDITWNKFIEIVSSSSRVMGLRQDRVFESRFISDRDDDAFPTRPTTSRQLTIAV